MNQLLSSQQYRLHSKDGQLPSKLERLLNLVEVEFQTGFKSSYLYQMIKEGKFPKPLKIGNCSRWRQSEIQNWIETQISKNV